MNPSTLSPSRIWLASALLAMSLPVLAQGASPDKASIEANYQRDRAACAAITAPADRTNCLRDAGAARAQALRAGTRTASPEELARNAVQRCQQQPPEQKVICERMARGEGNVSGSVEGGGVIRELVTQEKLPPPPSPPLSPPTSPPPVRAVPMPSPMSTPPMTSPPPMSPPPVSPAPLPPSTPTLPR
jgi:hypothetical protein